MLEIFRLAHVARLEKVNDQTLGLSFGASRSLALPILEGGSVFIGQRKLTAGYLECGFLCARVQLHTLAAWSTRMVDCRHSVNWQFPDVLSRN